MILEPPRDRRASATKCNEAGARRAEARTDRSPDRLARGARIGRSHRAAPVRPCRYLSRMTEAETIGSIGVGNLAVAPGEIATHVTGLHGSIVFDGTFAV